MAMRSPAGFISAFFDPLKNPNAPTSPAATAGDASASVSFTAPANVGGSAITAYYAVSNPGQITASAASSPVSVTGLTNGTAYTFNVWALNSYGPGVWSAATGSVTPAQLLRGLIAGGQTTNVIEYINIASAGNSTSFGVLTSQRSELSSMSNATRAVFAGGSTTTTMDYVTIATTGNATSFGGLQAAIRQMSQGSVNDSTRGIVGGGYTTGTVTQIQYITIGTTGNSSVFGSLTGNDGYWPGSLSSTTRGVFAGGGGQTIMTYITIQSTGNSTTFGNMGTPRDGSSGCSNSTRGLFSQGYTGADFTSVIEYITIASTGSSTTFGNCANGSRGSSAMSSPTRAVIVLGSSGYPYASTAMGYVEIATTGNTTNFGSLTVSAGSRTACSNCNGGV